MAGRARIRLLSPMKTTIFITLDVGLKAIFNQNTRIHLPLILEVRMVNRFCRCIMFPVLKSTYNATELNLNLMIRFLVLLRKHATGGVV